MAEYRPFQTQIPSTVRDEFKMYSIKVRKTIKLRDLCTEAALAYIEAVKTGKATPLSPEELSAKYGDPKTDWDPWTLHFESEALKELKKFCIDIDREPRDFVVCMLLYYLQNPITKPE